MDMVSSSREAAVMKVMDTVSGSTQGGCGHEGVMGKKDAGQFKTSEMHWPIRVHAFTRLRTPNPIPNWGFNGLTFFCRGDETKTDDEESRIPGQPGGTGRRSDDAIKVYQCRTPNGYWPARDKEHSTVASYLPPVSPGWSHIMNPGPPTGVTRRRRTTRNPGSQDSPEEQVGGATTPSRFTSAGHPTATGLRGIKSTLPWPRISPRCPPGGVT
ncbi:uncharacterized protein [Paramormyrops kingsleyae]|uniref:uncharacterized protein n=1 Tax=Paramormyrops kingsleyae TaxID=1676925 RepID=UPI003B97483C